jgi:hypothetical protein
MNLYQRRSSWELLRSRYRRWAEGGPGSSPGGAREEDGTTVRSLGPVHRTLAGELGDEDGRKVFLGIQKVMSRLGGRTEAQIGRAPLARGRMRVRAPSVHGRRSVPNLRQGDGRYWQRGSTPHRARRRMSTAPDLTVQGAACKAVYIEFNSRRCLEEMTRAGKLARSTSNRFRLSAVWSSRLGSVAHQEERRSCKAEVVGSSPTRSTAGAPQNPYLRLGEEMPGRSVRVAEKALESRP